MNDPRKNSKYEIPNYKKVPNTCQLNLKQKQTMCFNTEIHLHTVTHTCTQKYIIKRAEGKDLK